jgi:hypothetical protein
MRATHRRGCLRIVGALLLCTLPTFDAGAADYFAGPRDYRAIVARLRAGDTLRLAPGRYRQGLDVRNLSGRADAPIAIVGASGDARTVFVASVYRNTVSIVDSAYVRVADLNLEGPGAVVDAVKAEHGSHYAHHITLERLRIEGYDANQQIVAISTKCPAWNWTIRDNTIVGAGTGMYLGDSDGSAPFLRSVIEGNIVVGTLGYSIQVKHQNAWPRLEGDVDGPAETMIRYNTLRKGARSSRGKMARPNLLLGHWPLEGRGSTDRYLVYGNVIVDNPGEALMQAEGNVVAYNNVFINPADDAVLVREHKDRPRSIDIFHNTVVARGIGVMVRNGDPRFSQIVSDNVVYSFGVRPPRLAVSNDVHTYDEAQPLMATLRGQEVAVPQVRKPVADALPDEVSRARAALPDALLDVDRRPRHRDIAGAYAGDRPPLPRPIVDAEWPYVRRAN